jgi:hypothetical protein
MVADELRRQADNFIELQDLMPHIARARIEGAAPMAGGQPTSPPQPNMKDVAQNLATAQDEIQDVA